MFYLVKLDDIYLLEIKFAIPLLCRLNLMIAKGIYFYIVMPIESRKRMVTSPHNRISFLLK